LANTPYCKAYSGLSPYSLYPCLTHQKMTAANKPASGASATSIANGKKIYTKNCLSCHQADGSGVQNMNPPLTGTTYVLGDKDRIIKIILSGFNEGVEINGQTFSNAMPSFNKLNDKDIADVITYVRSHFTNKASAVMPEDVTTIRASINKP
jgi:mono/diheme cytochrome c family protein